MGKSQGNQTVTQQTKLPAWYEDAAKAAIAQAELASKNLAQPYQGNTVAALDPLQQQAIGAIGANIGSTNAGFAQAAQGAQSVMGYNPQMVNQSYKYDPTKVKAGSFLQGDIDAYMNPYINNVEKQAMSRLEDQRLVAQNSNADMASQSGAFGGSRHGIREALTDVESSRSAGELSSNLRSQAFNNASGLMQQDMARSMQAQMANQQAGLQNAQFGANFGMQQALANQQAGLQGAQLNLSAANSLGNLTAAGQQSYLQGLQAALGAGELNQQQEQALLNQQQQQYNAIRNYPQEQLNILLAALGGSQIPTSTSTTTPTTGNWLTGAAGGALAGMSLGPWGALAGGLLGGIAGAQ